MFNIYYLIYNQKSVFSFLFMIIPLSFGPLMTIIGYKIPCSFFPSPIKYI